MSCQLRALQKDIGICSVFIHVVVLVFVCVLFHTLVFAKTAHILATFPLFNWVVSSVLCRKHIWAQICFSNLSLPTHTTFISSIHLDSPNLPKFWNISITYLNVYLFKLQNVFSKFQNISASLAFLFPHKPPFLGVRRIIAPLFTQYTLIISRNLHSSNILWKAHLKWPF